MSFPKPKTFFSLEEMVHCTRFVAGSMLDFYEIPSQFIEDDFKRLVLEAFELCHSAEGMREVHTKSKTLADAVKEHGSEPVAIVAVFSDVESVLCVVGSSKQYYVIDLFHEICYSTTKPEYDVKSYIQEYGSDECDIKIYKKTNGEEEPAAEAAAVVAVPPITEKKKKPAVKKPKVEVAVEAAAPEVK